MSIESLMRAVSVKSNSFYDSYGQGGGNNSELRLWNHWQTVQAIRDRVNK